MASGVAVDPEVIAEYNELKLRHHCRYIIFSMSGDLKKIIVLKKGPLESNYDDFVSDMEDAANERQCRYAVYDAKYALKNGQAREKLVFYVWCPENATVKQKMLYTSSKDTIKKSLVGVNKEVQCTDSAELSWENTLDKLLSTEGGN